MITQYRGGLSRVSSFCLPIRSATRRSNFVRVQAGGVLHDDGAGVLLGLQQAGHELDLVDTDELGGLFESHEDVEPVRDHILELLVPRGRVRLAGELYQLLPLSRVVDSVELKEVGDVTFLERDPAKLHPADLGSRGADVVASVVSRDARGLTEAPELGAEQHSSTVGPPAGAAPPGALALNAVPSR